MIYRTEDIYKKVKNGPAITTESEFMNLYNPKSGEPSITDKMLFPAFSDLRLSLGQNFKLDISAFCSVMDVPYMLDRNPQQNSKCQML